MSKTLYIVVREDRHCDDGITVHATRELADAAIEAFKAVYPDDHKWTEQNYGAPKWVRYVETSFDDGPRARIEVCELDGEL